jgi:hypothetical protein
MMPRCPVRLIRSSWGDKSTVNGNGNGGARDESTGRPLGHAPEQLAASSYTPLDSRLVQISHPL